MWLSPLLNFIENIAKKLDVQAFAEYSNENLNLKK